MPVQADAKSPRASPDEILRAVIGNRTGIGAAALKNLRHVPRFAAYGLALAIGCAAAAAMLPLATLAGTGGMFAFPTGDLALNLTGHLAYQLPGWHWPLLQAPALAWPTGESIAMTDSNPALSILAKLIAMAAGHPVNLFGVWFAACLVLQPTAAVYALRGFQRHAAPAGAVNGWCAVLAAAGLALLLPAFLFRTFAINLFAHFLLLASLGLAARRCAAHRPPDVQRFASWLFLAVMVHPYLFIFSAITLSAPAVQLLIRRDARARDAVTAWALSAMLPIGGFMLLNFTLGGGGPGFGLYSTNLLSPVWPQTSGLFGATLPLLDATGYQREGFNYLGAGIVLIGAAAMLCLAWAGGGRRRIAWQRFGGLIAALGCLTLLAVTPQVTFGHVHLLRLDIPVLDRLLAAMRSSGRAIWVVDYGMVLAGLALLARRLPAAFFAPLVAAALVLQWIDTAPLRLQAAATFAGEGDTAPDLVLPRDSMLFHIVPLCNENAHADAYRLMAFRADAKLAEMRLAHPPLPAACAQALERGLGLPLSAGETRLFLPEIAGRVQMPALGAGAACATVNAGLLCHRAR